MPGVVGPHELEGAKGLIYEGHGELEVDIRVVDLDHFDQKLTLTVEMHGRLKSRAAIEDVMRDRVQQPLRRLRWQAGDQQLWQPIVMQANRIGERTIAFDELHCPAAFGDDVPQAIEVIRLFMIEGVVGV